MIYYPDRFGYAGVDYAFVNGLLPLAVPIGGSIWGGNYIVPTTVLFTNTGPNMAYAQLGTNIELLQPFSKTIIGGTNKDECVISCDAYAKIRIDAFSYKLTGAAKASLYDNTLNVDKFKPDVLCVIPFDSGPLSLPNPDTVTGFPTRTNRTVNVKMNVPLVNIGYKGFGTEYCPQSFIYDQTALVITVINTNYVSDPFKKMTVEFSVYSTFANSFSFDLGIIALSNGYDYVKLFENSNNITSYQRVLRFRTERNSNGQFYYWTAPTAYNRFNVKQSIDLTDFIRVAITIDFTKLDDNIALFIDGKFIDTYTDVNFGSAYNDIKYFGVKVCRTNSNSSIANLRVTENIRYTGTYPKIVRSFRDFY